VTVEMKNMARPDNEMELPDQSGRMETVHLDGFTVTRMTLQPGWSWEKSVRPLAGTEWCEVAHNQIIESGSIRITMRDGTEIVAGPQDALVAPPGHHAEVIGPAPLVAWDITFGSGGIADVLSARRLYPGHRKRPSPVLGGGHLRMRCLTCRSAGWHLPSLRIAGRGSSGIRVR